MIRNKFNISKTAVLALFLAAMVASVAPASAASAGTEINFGADATPNPWTTAGVTVANHDMTWDSPLMYEGDDGSVQTMDASVNESVDNPYSYVATDLNVSDFGAYPHDKEDVSALTASEWSATTGVSVSDVETANGVDAVQVASNGSFSSGDSATATFSNFSVTSDVQKRFVTVVYDVSTLDSGATAQVRIVDGDGDYYASEVNTSRSSGEDFMTNTTGEGFVYQRQIGKMTLNSAGDGSFGDIQSVKVVVSDADATLEISGLNVERMSMYDFGTEKQDTDDDDDLETVDIKEKKTTGAIKVHSLDTLGDAFSDAEIKGLTIAVREYTEDLDASDVNLETKKTGNQYPGYYGTATVYYRVHLEDAYDLGWANTDRNDNQSVTSDRVLSVEYAEGVSEDTEFADISDSAWTDKTSLYTGKDAQVDIDDTIQPGEYAVIKYHYKLTEEQWNAIQNTGGAGGAGGFWGGSGGFFGGFVNWLAAGLVSIGAILGLTKRKNSGV